MSDAPIDTQELIKRRAYFRILKKFEQYAHEPFEKIWTKYNQFNNFIINIFEDEDLPQHIRDRAKRLLKMMKLQSCFSAKDVIKFTKYIFEQSLLLAASLENPASSQRLFRVASELLNTVNEEIKN